ncbi:adenosylmethionine--8-amino-7-oxononanoate transaminase [Rhodoplanes sp. Z2-YC6860]|uniref:adenosylmethionine--8-amino-7-oxononanoate transaminase n=1 Tax=Rhodoplanes sp. Z2-YC6860 TaxID=674703 RepID=UPI00078D67A5|nr:adenosylmethionine--8-amino-7-oxononanoate transaminase [Rhodoplanes sp. Z2-YC6860]AMN42028.1 adenosylmethionine--8-amino-7-oxononanoate transaminase [Rhodoplanes sp. Z2-YC6860]
MDWKHWYEPGLDHVWLPYAQMKTARPPLAAAATEGCRIKLADGRELIDGIASWWTACHGYNHPHIRTAVERQLAAMPHVMFSGLVHEQALTLARRLAKLLPGDLDRVFFSESGSVAIEIAMKMALQAAINRGERQRTRFVAFKGGYHGDTTGAMSVTDPDGMHALFRGLLPAQSIVELPITAEGMARFLAFLQEEGDSIAGLIVEPLVQGAGGMLFHAAATLKHIRAAADACGALLIFDEIFTGLGRTGTLFASEQAGVVPDIITLSKALTGGTLPLAVTVASKRVFDSFWSDDSDKALMHGPTYMGNPLACAAANASLDLFEREPRLDQVAAIGRQMAEQLAPCRGLPGVRDVRVKGAIGVVEMDRIGDLGALRARFIDEGVFVRPFGATIYLTPSFTIGADELSRLTAAIVKIVGQGV